MIRYAEPHADILKSSADAIINTTNTLGADGAGLARQFRDRYPENSRIYREACRMGRHAPGRPVITRLPNGQLILNMATKRDWRNPSEYEYVDANLEWLLQYYRKLGIRSVAMPPMGCGLGRLNAKEVRNRITRKFQDADDLDIILYGKWN